MMQERTLTLKIAVCDDVPGILHGCITDSPDGAIVIAVNAADTPERQLASFLHEAAHLFRADLDRAGESADQIEAETDQLLRAAAQIILDEPA